MLLLAICTGGELRIFLPILLLQMESASSFKKVNYYTIIIIAYIQEYYSNQTVLGNTGGVCIKYLTAKFMLLYQCSCVIVTLCVIRIVHVLQSISKRGMRILY